MIKETKTNTEDTTKEKSSQKPKKKSGAGKIILIILVILLVIALLCGGIALFVYRGVSDRVEEAEDVWREIEQEVERTEQEWEEFEEPEVEETESELPKVSNSLEARDLLSDRFPGDIPLSGGKIRESSFDNWSVSVVIMTSSSVEDAYQWYEEAMGGTDWIITSKSRQDDRASISFENDQEDEDFRRGDISIYDSIWDYTTITIRERY